MGKTSAGPTADVKDKDMIAPVNMVEKEEQEDTKPVDKYMSSYNNSNATTAYTSS